jgi:hypothetical protein
MRNYFELIHEFYDYVWSFYNLENGIYPLASDKEIQLACNKFLESKNLDKIYFDSIDREAVRKILQPNYQF